MPARGDPAQVAGMQHGGRRNKAFLFLECELLNHCLCIVKLRPTPPPVPGSSHRQDPKKASTICPSPLPTGHMQLLFPTGRREYKFTTSMPTSLQTSTSQNGCRTPQMLNSKTPIQDSFPVVSSSSHKTSFTDAVHPTNRKVSSELRTGRSDIFTEWRDCTRLQSARGASCFPPYSQAGSNWKLVTRKRSSPWLGLLKWL